jgi:Beta-galactosidase
MRSIHQLLVLRICPVLAAGLWLTWPAHCQSNETPERSATPQCTSAAKAKPSGLVVLLPSGERNYQAMNLQVLNNTFMNGVAVQINWRDIEPEQGKPDWMQLDALFAAAESAKKWVHLIMFPGFFSPAWALEGAQTDVFKIQYGPGKGTDARLPMPWDRVYLDRWFTFLKLLSARYGRSPAFRMIAAAGPTSVSVEMTVPNSPTAHQQWLKDSYTPAKYLSAWEDTFHFYAGAFPNQCISLAAPGLPILGPGPKGPPAHLRVKLEIVEKAIQVLGNRLAIQSSDLHAGHAQVEAPDNTDFIIGYSGRIMTGFEMRSGSQGEIASKVMGAEGDPALALRRSIEKGMAPNGTGRHVDYLEIYVADVLPANMQPALSYAASLFQQEK